MKKKGDFPMGRDRFCEECRMNLRYYQHADWCSENPANRPTTAIPAAQMQQQQQQQAQTFETKGVWWGFFLSTEQFFMILILIMSLINEFAFGTLGKALLLLAILIYCIVVLPGSKKGKFLFALFITIASLIFSLISVLFLHLLSLILVAVLVVWFLHHLYVCHYNRLVVYDHKLTHKWCFLFFFPRETDFFYSSLASVGLKQNKLEEKAKIGDLEIENNHGDKYRMNNLRYIKKVRDGISDRMPK